MGVSLRLMVLATVLSAPGLVAAAPPVLEGPVAAWSNWCRPGSSGVAGTFRLESSGADRFDEPLALRVDTPAGWLFAERDSSSRVFEPPPRDSDTALLLRPDAPSGATCTTGTELDCWLLGDALPPGAPVVEALCRGFSGHPTLCPLRSWVVPELSFPSDPLEAAPVGCGPLLGTDCDVHGADLLFADSPAVLARIGEPLASADPLERRSSASESSEDPSARRCSLQTPQYCASICDLWLLVPTFATAMTSRLLPDDPRGPLTRRWLWEAGVELTVVEASGDESFAATVGSTVYVLGPEVPGNPAWRIGVPIIVVPPAREDETSDTPVFYYGLVPEPDAGLLGAAALATIALQGRRKRRQAPWGRLERRRRT